MYTIRHDLAVVLAYFSISLTIYISLLLPTRHTMAMARLRYKSLLALWVRVILCVHILMPSYSWLTVSTVDSFRPSSPLRSTLQKVLWTKQPVALISRYALFGPRSSVSPCRGRTKWDVPADCILISDCAPRNGSRKPQSV